MKRFLIGSMGILLVVSSAVLGAIDIRGRVVDDQAQPIAGASVTLITTGLTTTTDGNGEFIITSGSHVINGRLPGVVQPVAMTGSMLRLRIGGIPQAVVTELMNLQGKVVSVIERKTLSAGTYCFDPFVRASSKVPAGVYILHVKMGVTEWRFKIPHVGQGRATALSALPDAAGSGMALARQSAINDSLQAYKDGYARVTTSVAKDTLVTGDIVLGKSRLLGTADLDSLKLLFASRKVALDTSLVAATLYDLKMAEIGSQTISSASKNFQFDIVKNGSYIVKLALANGTQLWCITGFVAGPTNCIVSLASTYKVALIGASLAGNPPAGDSAVAALIPKADQVLQKNLDRLALTTKRIVDNATLKKVTWDPFNETREHTLRAFGGGLTPVRTLDRIIDTTYYDYIPYIYVRRVLNPMLPSNILISEIDNVRWDFRVQGKAGHDGGQHVVNGGTMITFDSDRHYPDCKTCTKNTLLIYTLRLDADTGTPPTALTDTIYNSQDPAFSWDERSIAYTTNQSGSYNIWVMNTDGTGKKKLTSDTGTVTNLKPRWTPDNTKIVYSSNRSGNWEIWIMSAADGSGNTNLTNLAGSTETSARVSPDGRQILFHSSSTSMKTEIYVMDIDGKNQRRLTNNIYYDEDPCWDHTGLECIYSSGAKSNNTEMTIRGMNVLTGDSLFEFGDFAAAVVYERPIWAATQNVLIVAQRVVTIGGLLPNGTATDAAGDLRSASANPSVGTTYNVNSVPSSVNPYDYMVSTYKSYDIPQPAPYMPLTSWF
jgi:hypothetical protein